MKQLNDKDIESISVLTIDSRRPETIGLIKKHGINLPMNAPTKLVDKAFLSLAKQSDKFREDFSALAYDTSVSFTGSNEGDFFNANAQGKPVGTTNPAIATSTDAKTGGGFWSYLSEVFTPDTTKNIVNTALNIWSVKQTGQNAATTQNNLDQARFDLQEGGTTSATQGMGVGTIILISVGALALIGGIIYFVRKK